MSPLPAMSSPGRDLYERLSPLAAYDEENDYAFAVLCGAIGAMWEQVAYLSEDRDERPGWAVMVDVETAPAYALPWLATHAGVKLTKGATEDVQRDEVRRRSGVARGRPASMRAKIATTLTGDNPSAQIIERAGGSAWQIVVRTRTDQTPDPAATFAAATSEKPGGDVLTHVVGDDVLWEEATLDWDAVDPGVTWDTVTLGDVT